jgi:ribosomal protein S18 acetylase RimI-like enzyme
MDAVRKDRRLRESGLSVRAAGPADAAAIARVHVETWRAAYRGIVADEYLDALSVAVRQERWAAILSAPETDCCNFVALVEGGEVAGFASGGPQRGDVEGYAGELYAVYVVPAAQGRGLGRMLTAAVAAALRARGMDSMLVRVLALNPARRFYERLGGRPGGESETKIGDRTLRSVAYGWSDTAPLIGEGPGASGGEAL